MSRGFVASSNVCSARMSSTHLSAVSPVAARMRSRPSSWGDMSALYPALFVRAYCSAAPSSFSTT
eukprot:1984387-Prorocentrum_lima.AAC.1